MNIPRARVAVAGGSGFVGRALVQALSATHDVIVLGRSTPKDDLPAGACFRRCDLYDAESSADALAGATIAVYLVHSMLPSARLVQASFRDLDAICADNFARAAARAGIDRIVYLGGLIPPAPAKLSAHLASRLEVERLLAAYGASVTTLRAGMVIGAGGSSFQIMVRLVERLPWMIVPRWGSSRSQPIGLDEVVRLLVFAIEHPEYGGRAYDVGSPSILPYREMLARTAALLGRKTRITSLPFDVPVISLLWVSTITGAPLDLVMPLVESLKHEMIAAQGLELQQASGITLRSFDELVRDAIRHEAEASARAVVPARRAAAARPKRVVSLQRFATGRARSARALADAYFGWLPRGMWPLVRVRPLSVPGCSFHLAGWAPALLELTLDEAASDETRAVYRISGGVLVASAGVGVGSLEFRTLLEREVGLALVSNFEPRLPWLLYKSTQALAHLWVMKAFGRELVRAARAG